MSLRPSSSSTAPAICKEEVFGPVLHVVRWRAEELDALLDDIAANGTALTLGIHSRIDLTIERIAARLPHGNVYVNRNMIGAVVGTQPFGGTPSVRHRPQGGRPELSAPLRDRAGGYGQYGGGRGQCRSPGPRRMKGRVEAGPAKPLAAHWN